MDINRTSGKRGSIGQRNLVIARSDQATVRGLWKALAVVVFGLLLSAPAWAQEQYRFITIDVPEATATAANGNSTHEIAGQFDDASGNTHGFVLNKGVFTTIDVPGAVFTIINGINASGRLAGTYSIAGDLKPNHAFFWSKGDFTTLDPPGATRSQGGFLNAQGEVVGTYRDNVEKRHGFIWRKGNFTTFNVPGDHPVLGTVALGINDKGQIVGNYVAEEDNQRHGFLRSSKGDFTTLDVPGADTTIAQGINNAGTIVGAYVVGDIIHGFVLTNGVFTTVDVKDALETQIFSINAKGEIVGLYIDAAGVTHGFLGTPVR
jgi:uncharacterized membrane protein